MTSMEDINNNDANGWGVDKRVPLTFIFVVVVQTIAITWGAATLASDVKNYGAKIVKLEKDFSDFVDKADVKYELTSNHNAKELYFNSTIKNLHNEIVDLKVRVRDLELKK